MALEYFCHCLNIHLSIPEGVLQEEPNDALTTEAVKSDSFFQDVFIVFAPRKLTANQKLQCLCRNREVEEWWVTSCVNCGMDVYATRNCNGNAVTIAVSSSVERDPSSAVLLSNQDNYSPIYKVLVSPLPTSNPSENTVSVTRDLAHKQLEELKEQTVQLLNAENERLLERIRNYENEQMSHFNELQTRVHREQNILAEVLMNYHRENISSSHRIVTSPVSSTSPKPKSVSVSSSSVVSEKSSKTRLSHSTTNKQSDDIMFAMDEDDDDDDDDVLRQPDGSQADDILEENDDPSHVRNGQTNDYDDDSDDAFSAEVKLYATSMPIAMPRAWQSSMQSEVSADETGISLESKHTKDDPQWIAASIQALAMSVRGNDGTEMFGARPRPRLNTLD